MLKRTFIHVNGEDILKRKEMFKAETIQIGISSKFQYVCQVLFNPLLPVGRYMSQMLYAGPSARENVPFLSDF